MTRPSGFLLGCRSRPQLQKPVGIMSDLPSAHCGEFNDLRLSKRNVGRYNRVCVYHKQLQLPRRQGTPRKGGPPNIRHPSLVVARPYRNPLIVVSCRPSLSVSVFCRYVLPVVIHYPLPVICHPLTRFVIRVRLSYSLLPLCGIS